MDLSPKPKPMKKRLDHRTVIESPMTKNKAPKDSDNDDGGKKSEKKKTKTKTEKKRVEDFKIYINKILQELFPDLSLSIGALDRINRLVNEVLERIAKEASKIAKRNEDPMEITDREIQAALRVVFSGPRAHRCVCEGTKAVGWYCS